MSMGRSVSTPTRKHFIVMAAPFSCLLAFFAAFVCLSCAQPICEVPPEEKCVCSPVVNVGTDDVLKSEVEQLKIAMEQLSRNKTVCPEQQPPVVTCACGNDDALKSEVRELIITVAQLSQNKTDCHEAIANDTDENKPKDCLDILDNDETTPSGVYMVYPRDNLGGFLVFCDMDTDGGGWTLFQKRHDGTVDFYRDWAEYKTGFPSNLNGEFWLGNDNLYRLAVQKVYQLRVDMEDFAGNTAYAAYDSFFISPESQNYQLHLGAYLGTAGDSMTRHNGHPFSTKDRDNDEHPSTSCAQMYKGGWWYERCHSSNLNGLYRMGTHGDGVIWHLWKRAYYSLKRAEMKIRPVL